MTVRNTHDRLADHFGDDLDTNMKLNGAVGSIPSGTILHDALVDLHAGLPGPVAVGLSLVMDGSSNPIQPGIKGDLEVPFACTITAVRLFADQAASLVLDIWKAAYAGFPPLVGGTICASAKPHLSATAKSQDTTLTGWTTAVSAGDILRVHIDSNDLAQRLTLALTFSR